MQDDKIVLLQQGQDSYDLSTKAASRHTAFFKTGGHNYMYAYIISPRYYWSFRLFQLAHELERVLCRGREICCRVWAYSAAPETWARVRGIQRRSEQRETLYSDVV